MVNEKSAIIGKLCRFVYYDGTVSEENIRSLKGIIVSQDENFTTLRTLTVTSVINNRQILKIVPLKEQPENNEVEGECR